MEYGTEIVFKNNKYLTPVTFEFIMSHNLNKMNIYERHRNIFVAIKLVDNTAVIIDNFSKNTSTQKNFRPDKTTSKHFHQKPPTEISKNLRLFQSRVFHHN